MSIYQVIVGNIDTVYDGTNGAEARRIYGEYKRQSTNGYGRASREPVTLMCDDAIKFEHVPVRKLPKIGELRKLFIALKPDISDEYRCSDDPEDNTPGMCVTIGASPDGSWSYQTGDNSYTGGAYGHPDWAVCYLYRRSNSLELARDAVDQIAELQVQS